MLCCLCECRRTALSSGQYSEGNAPPVLLSSNEQKTCLANTRSAEGGGWALAFQKAQAKRCIATQSRAASFMILTRVGRTSSSVASRLRQHLPCEETPAGGLPDGLRQAGSAEGSARTGWLLWQVCLSCLCMTYKYATITGTRRPHKGYCLGNSLHMAAILTYCRGELTGGVQSV